MNDSIMTDVKLAGTPPLLELIDRAIDLLDDERSIFLDGQYERLPDVLQVKSKLLEQLELAMQTATRTARFVSAVKRLIDASRRNEQIIRAAQQGLSHARRRLKAIDEMHNGAVAYSEDGSRISSRADQIRDRKSA